MRDLSNKEEIDVGGASYLLLGPIQGDNALVAQTGRLVIPIPFLPATESNFVQGSRSVWVYYPQGLLRRPMADTDVYWAPVAGTLQVLPHVCQGVNSMKEINEITPYPGHSVFQESFFFCRIKNVGDDPGAGDVYVETAVDSQLPDGICENLFRAERHECGGPPQDPRCALLRALWRGHRSRFHAKER